MYPHSHIVARAIVRVYVFVTGLMLIIFRWCPWPLYVPPQIAVRPARSTDKKQYQRERFMYRMAHDLEVRGYTLKKNYYYEYALIAKKYNWPYIKEAYDNTPDEVEWTDWSLGLHSFFCKIFSQANRRRTFRAWLGLDIAISLFLLTEGFSTVLFLQVYFVLPYILFKIIARQFQDSQTT